MIWSFDEIIEEVTNDPRIKDTLNLTKKQVKGILREYFRATIVTLKVGFLKTYFKGVKLGNQLYMLVSPRSIEKNNTDGKYIEELKQRKKEYERRTTRRKK